jgi:hypothetical protein
MTTLADLQKDVRDRFRAKSAWAALADSEMVGQMSDLLGALFFETLQEIENARHDSFLSTATSRKAILAHAAERGYKPTKPLPPKGTVKITNLGANDVIVPAWVEFLDAANLTYYNTEGITVPAGQYRILPIEHRTKESRLISGLGIPYQEVQLCDHTMLLAQAEIDLLDGNPPVQVDFVEDFWTASDDEFAAELFYDVDDSWNLRFGNGEFGRIPPNASQIEIVIWKTNPLHQLVANSKLYLATSLTDVLGFGANLQAVVESPVTGGFFRATTERIREEAKASQNLLQRMVWKRDYEHVLKKELPELNFVNVWGEQEQEKQEGKVNSDYINKVFVSAHSTLNNSNLSLRVLDALGKWPKPLTVQYQFVECQPMPFRLRASGRVPEGVDPNDFQTALLSHLNTYYGQFSPSRRAKFEIGECFDGLFEAGILDAQAKRSLSIEMREGPSYSHILEGFIYLSQVELDFY